MITCDQIKKDVDESLSCYVWEYNNKPCGIDPVVGKYNLWYGNKNLYEKTWQEILNASFFDGKTLQEILPDIKDYGLG